MLVQKVLMFSLEIKLKFIQGRYELEIFPFFKKIYESSIELVLFIQVNNTKKLSKDFGKTLIQPLDSNEFIVLSNVRIYYYKDSKRIDRFKSDFNEFEGKQMALRKPYQEIQFKFLFFKNIGLEM
ncbi:unnamed protein product [Paramecium pentaurelia]|uniref:Uncharacterized protein n=1 Tax=Paramecium pentaurelia TaxID=43138 RepID=A0A8S1VYW7_9CILI|nr:unnamed protein product [Paramecium pentaurelia]